MKTSNTLVVALATAALFSLAVPVSAQHKATGDDGIAASPRLRARLNERAAQFNTAVATPAAMSCAACKDEYVKRIDRSARGATKPTIIVPTHLCGGCETTISVAGTGKGKRDLVNHRCSLGKSTEAACCITAANR